MPDVRFASCLLLAVAITVAPCKAQVAPAPSPSADSARASALDDSSSIPDVRPPVDHAVQTALRPLRLALVAGGLSGLNAGVFIWEKSRWWSDARVPFHFDDHLDYAQNLDKLGHFFATDVQALLAARLLGWSGVRPARAALWGAGLALLFQTHVEIHDGFSPRWGFDRYDAAANFLGAAWFYAHERAAFLEPFSIRWSYFPSAAWRASLRERRANHTTFADDYSGHSYWLSARLGDFLPTGWKRYWPRFLALSLGVSVNDWQEAQPESGYRSYYLGLDLDARRLLPRRTPLGRALGDLFDRLHLPGPAIRLYPGPTFYLFYYGQ